MVPWLAYDWSPIEASGDGTYETGIDYTDPEFETVANENLPSDNLEVVVRLREGIPFHRSEDWFDEQEKWQSPYTSHEITGEKMEEMTAHDVVFSIEMLMWEAPQYRSNYLRLNRTTRGNDSDITDPNWIINGGSGMYEGVQMLGDYSVRFELEKYDSLFYTNMLPIVLSMKVWAGHTLLNEGEENALNWDCGQVGSIGDQKESIVGTGQFMWADWDPGSLIKLDTNPDYWIDGTLDEEKAEGTSLKKVDLRPSFSGIEYFIQSSYYIRPPSLLDDVDINLQPLDPGYISEFQNHPDTDIMVSPSVSTYYIGFNFEVPAFGRILESCSERP